MPTAHGRRPAALPPARHQMADPHPQPAAVSAPDGSLWPENVTVAGEPSSTGPLFPSEAVGGTFATVTLKVFVSEPPSLSVTFTLTV